MAHRSMATVAFRRPQPAVRAARSVFPLQLLEIAGVESRPRQVPEDLGVFGLPQHQCPHTSGNPVQVGRGGLWREETSVHRRRLRDVFLPARIVQPTRNQNVRAPPPLLTLTRSRGSGARIPGCFSARTAGPRPDPGVILGPSHAKLREVILLSSQPPSPAAFSVKIGPGQSCLKEPHPGWCWGRESCETI